MDLFSDIRKICRAEADVSMAEHTSFRCGGRAAVFAEPAGEVELSELLRLLSGSDTPYIVIGNGSNLLFARDYAGVAVHIGRALDFIERKGENGLIAGAGTMLSRLSRAALEYGLSGMECACGIPGSVGGACFMNAGAYGFEMKNVLREVRSMKPDGSVIRRSAEEMGLGYRKSVFMDSDEVILSAEVSLAPGDRAEMEALMNDCTAKRNAKQPVNLPSAGSFFKRPEGYFAGKLIEDSGLKGLTIGGAQVSPLHAGFIVNVGGATADDVVQLMHVVQETVMHDHGVALEPEVRIIG